MPKAEGAPAAPASAPTGSRPAGASSSGSSGSSPADPAATRAAEAARGESVYTDLMDEDEFLNILYFGVEGTGKTTAAMFAANLPGDGDFVVVNAEAGVRKRALSRLGVDVGRIKIWKPESGLITYEELEKEYYRLAARLRAEPGSVKAVCFDSLTEISNKILENASLYWYMRDQRNDKKHWSEKRDTPEVTEIQDYGLMTTQGRKLMRKFRDLPCHFIVTALEVEGQGEGEFKAAKKQASPELSPKFRTSVLGYVDAALRLTSETLPVGPRESETLVWARTKPSMLVRAKDRDGIFPRDLPEPRFDRLVDYFEGETKAATDEVFDLYAGVKERSEAYRAERAKAKAAQS